MDPILRRLTITMVFSDLLNGIISASMSWNYPPPPRMLAGTPTRMTITSQHPAWLGGRSKLSSLHVLAWQKKLLDNPKENKTWLGGRSKI